MEPNTDKRYFADGQLCELRMHPLTNYFSVAIRFFTPGRKKGPLMVRSRVI
jgi:hypothetical protein